MTGSREGWVNMQPEAGWDPMCPGPGLRDPQYLMVLDARK